MNDDLADRVVPASTHRWGLLEKRFGTRVRASDTAWATTLSPADRLAIVEELFGVAYAAHERAGDWAAVDELAWRETLAERRRLTAAFHRLDEGRHSRSRRSAPRVDRLESLPRDGNGAGVRDRHRRPASCGP